MSEKSSSELPLEEENISNPELHEKSLGEFDLGHLMAKFIIPIEKDDQEESNKNMSEIVDEERRNELGDIFKKHRVDLSRTGLSIEPVDVGARIMGSGEDLS